MTFDAEWASPYEPQSCSEGTFHASDGTEQTVTYLSGEERGYLEVAGAAVLPHRRRDGCRHPCGPDPDARRCAGAPAQGA